MPYQGCPGQGASLTAQALTSTSQQQQCGLCKRLPIRTTEAYSCDLHILDPVPESQQVTCMSTDDWHKAQLADMTLSLVITRLWEGTPGQWQAKQTDPPKCNQFLWEWNHLWLQKSVLYRRARSRESKETLFQLVCQLCTETALRGCHDKVGHLGLEQILLMCNQFYWTWMAVKVKKHINKCHPCLTFKAKQPKALLENIVAMHALELVHLDFLCLEPGKGLEENVLVVTDHFTWFSKHMSHDPRPPKQWSKPSGTISSLTVGCPKRSSQLRGEIQESAGGWSLQVNGDSEVMN